MAEQNLPTVLDQKGVALIGTASQVLAANQTRLQKATEARDKVLAYVQEHGMSEEVDQKCNDLLVKIKKTIEVANKERSPITQLFRAVASQFTGVENDLKELSGPIQAHRNAFAQAKAEEQRKREAAAKLKLDQENERVEIKAKVAEILEDHFSKHVELKQTEMLDQFEACDSKSIDNYAKGLDKMKVEFDQKFIDDLEFTVHFQYIDAKEMVSIIDAVKLDSIEKFKERYWSTIDDLRINLIEMAPARKQELLELEELERTNKAEAERKKKAQEKKAEEERQRVANETASKSQQAKETIAAGSESEKMNNLFDAESKMTVTDGSNAQVRKSWKITITHQKGFSEIFALYFQKEAMELSIDELSKKTLGSMVKYAEKLAKDDVFIESKFVKYTEDFTAVNKA